MMRAPIAVLLLFLTVAPVAAQTSRPNLPDPVRFVQKFDIVWTVTRTVLNEMGFAVELEDRKGGRIVTKPYEFITGSLTASEVEKVASKPDATGSLLKARYATEALLEIVSPTLTLVTVRTRMEALNRDLDGTEKWIPLESIGTYEKRILGRISVKLNGYEVEFGKKGFWDKPPQPVEPVRPRPFPSPPPR